MRTLLRVTLGDEAVNAGLETHVVQELLQSKLPVMNVNDLRAGLERIGRTRGVASQAASAP